MKKIISVTLALVMLLSISLSSVSAYAQEVYDEIALNGFVDGIVELSQEYDAEKDFIVEVSEENTAIQFYNNGEETETQSDTEYDLVDFQTARLIVRADDKFDTYGAIKCISGFLNFYILQYDTPKEAQNAYIKLKNSVIEILPDTVEKIFSDEESTITTEKPDGEYLNEWSVHQTQSKQMQEYYENQSTIDEIVVGIIDTGVDYNHDYLKDRIIRSNFNSSNEGEANDEMDNDVLPHGTMVASVVVDNTPEFVKMSIYRVADSSGVLTHSAAIAGILKAIENDVDVINLSFGFGEDSSLIYETIMSAYKKNIPVINAAGNDSGISYDTLSKLTETITVASTTKNREISTFTTMTRGYTEISAPGSDILVALPNNKYSVKNGTSFSTPCVSSLVAVMVHEHPNWNVDYIKYKIESTAIPMDSWKGKTSVIYGKGLVQFCDALGITTLDKPKSNLSSNSYIGTQICSFDSNENLQIYYTLNGNYPNKDNAILYTEPFEISEYTRVRAVHYDPITDNYSSELDLKIRIKNYDVDSNFIIDENGIITDYIGNYSDLIIPEYISEIQVINIGNAFADSNIIGLTLPKTLSFANHGGAKNTIRFIEGDGVISIGHSGLANCPNLEYVNFPNLKSIGPEAFSNSSNLTQCDFSNLEKLEMYALQNCNINRFIAPKLKSVGCRAFYNSKIEYIDISNCTNYEETFVDAGLIDSTSYLYFFNVPMLTFLPANAFYSATITTVDLPSVEHTEIYAFDNSNIKRVQFSKLIGADSMPNKENCIIALPSTFTECTEDTKGRNYIIYGTEGTYAETWAEKNNHKFVILNSTNAILEDLPAEYYGLGEVLSPDVIGFNKTYQWYSNNEENNTTGTPIEGATDKEFNPADYPQAKYYYCVVTSTDVGYEPIEIRTGVTENTTVSTETILSPETSQIRFGTNDDGGFDNSFDVRTRAVITDEDFKAYIAPTNEIAEQKISQAGFVYTKNSTEFATELAQKVAKGEEIAGYTNAPVSFIQDADGYYMFACVITDIPSKDANQSITAYAYICVNGYWYFFDPEMTTDFGWLYDTYYPQAAEKYGW